MNIARLSSSLSVLPLLALLTFACCGIFNLTNLTESGEEKPPATAVWARSVLRGVTDSWLQVYGPDKIPSELLRVIDTNEDGTPTLLELESIINVSDPQALTFTVASIFLAIEKAKKEHPPQAMQPESGQ